MCQSVFSGVIMQSLFMSKKEERMQMAICLQV